PATRGAEPADHRLVPDAHVEDVVTAARDVLAPVQRRVAIDERGLPRGGQLDGEYLAHIAVGEQSLERGVDLERWRRRHQLGDELRRLARGFEHAPTLG